MRKGAAMGIIGGADGPTQIYLGAEIGRFDLFGLIIAALVLSIILYTRRHKGTANARASKTAHFMEEYKRLKVSFGMIAMWTVFYIADLALGWMPLLSGRGFFVINGEYYRLFTGFLLHGNVIHLAVNAAAMYWFGCYLERNLGSKRFFLFSAVAVLLAQAAYYALFPKIDDVFGGSMLTFTYIGLILALRLFKPSFPRLKLGTWRGNWIVIYAIAGNIPIFSFMNLYTVALHAVSLSVGFVVGVLFCRWGLTDF